MKKTLFISVGFLLLLALLLGSCVEKTPVTTGATTTTPKAPTSVSVATTAAPADKYGGIWKATMEAPDTPIGYPPETGQRLTNTMTTAFEGLILVKMDGTIVPRLATSYEIAQDKKSITLSLRKGVKFHDGSDFNADVCKWNLELWMAAKKTPDWTSIDKIDDYTIRINVKEWKNTILTDLAENTKQVSMESFNKNGIDWVRDHPVGTGPFIMEKYDRGSKMTFKKNPNYWDTGLPYLDGVEFSVIPDATVLILAFKKGDIYMLAGSQGVQIPNAEKEGFVVKVATGGTYALIPDSVNDKSPWSKYKVRLAASYALNREALAAAMIASGIGSPIPAYQIYTGEPQAHIPNLVKTEYNPSKAKQLLAEAGYPDGFDTTIHYASLIPADYMNAVAAQLRDVGIRVTLDFPTPGKFADLRNKGWDDGLMAGGLSNRGNVNASYSSYFLASTYVSMKRPDTLKQLINESLTSKEADTKLIQAVAQAVYDDMTLIPFVEETQIRYFQKGAHDEGANDYTMMTFFPQWAWLDPSLR